MDGRFKKYVPSFISVDVPNRGNENPPAPPRRVSSKNSRTLKLVTSTRPVSSSPKRNPTITQTQSNVDFLRERISNKLTRQNTHVITKRGSVPDTKMNADPKTNKSRVMSISAPPAVNRKAVITSVKTTAVSKAHGTSSFGSPRRTVLPTEYNTINSKYGDGTNSVVIEGGAGRKTPISNILDKVTSLDKLWSSEKRNERIDLAKAKSKFITRGSSATASRGNSSTKSTVPNFNIKSTSPNAVHKSRDMIRTAEKLQKFKCSNIQAKSNPCLVTKGETKLSKSLQNSANMSKSTTNVTSPAKKQTQIKTAVVTNLRKKKSLESVVIRPRSVPCHEACSKKSRDVNKSVKKVSKIKSIKKTTSKSSNDSESGSQFGDTSNELSHFGSFENIRKQKISSKEIKRTRDAVLSDSFFQHLFLRNCYYPSTSFYPIEANTSVLQKAKMFQSFPQDNTAPRSLNTYLIHRKPVSLSRFKLWDRYPSPTTTQSPRSVSWPGRTHTNVRKFDSLQKCEEFGSTSSLATVRSRSEPPINKMYFSQTSRPKSPTIVFFKKSREPSITRQPSPPKIFFSQTSRPVSPKITRKFKKEASPQRTPSLSPAKLIFTETVRPVSPTVTKRSTPKLEVIEIKCEEDRYPTTIFFSQTSRPVSPKVIRKSTSAANSRSQSTSPVSVRSPAYRRIYNVRLQGSKHSDTSVKSVVRTRSAGDADKKAPKDNLSTKTKSASNLHTADPDYEEYVLDMQNNKIRSERFRELNRYYAYLERVAELEKTTSTSDLRHRKRDEEIIDFDRWKKIRAIERAEEELNNLYLKLRLAQSENDVLFYPRDIKDFRWNYDRDRGLRIKEKSVEDLKDHFQQMPHYDSIDADQPKDTYKPLWRGTSVAETAFNINRKNETDNFQPRSIVKPVLTLHQESSLTELRKKIGLGNRLWSSLSLEQVNALKNQLNAIYSRELECKSNKDTENYFVDVKDEATKPSGSNLHVRCNSLITPPRSPESQDKELTKSESIAAISCPITSVKELKNNVNKIQMSLSENEKRKISQSISKEVLGRINKFENNAQPSLKQAIESNQMKKNGLKLNNSKIETSSEIIKEITHVDNEAEDENLRHIVYPVDNTHDIQCQSSASETETASSDVSNKTVIYREPKKDVQKKVEYFESVKNLSSTPKIIYHAREGSDEKAKQDETESKVSKEVEIKDVENTEPQKPIVQSQSCTNIKELFGESEKNKFLSLPSNSELYSRSPSPYSEVYVADRRTPDTPRYSSDETIWRSRSPSPDPERYWRAYLNLARAGEVRRLARRFDSPSAAGAVLRRHRSDPEIARNVLRCKWSSEERLSQRRDKSKGVLPVARMPLRPTNRYMPHIDVISKLAALRKRTTPRSRSAEEPPECRSGEVDRIRRRFEAMSILGQIYASAPDVSELRDIAPYLAGPWTAHRYPKRSDNNRSIKDPTALVRGRTSPVKREIKRTSSKAPVKLSSILKSDVFAKQAFDPSMHQPASRYEPPRAPPRPPPAAWPYRLAPFVTPSRHTVTFQGYFYYILLYF